MTSVWNVWIPGVLYINDKCMECMDPGGIYINDKCMECMDPGGLIY